MNPASKKRRRQRWSALGALALLAAATWLGRAALARLALTEVLQLAGASAIRFDVVAASPWHVELAQVDFRVRTQAFAADRLELERAHWWMFSLGTVRVTGARVPVNIDGSDLNPWAWSSYQNGVARLDPLNLPFEAITVDGRVLVQAAALPDQPVAVHLDARRTGGMTWNGRATATAPGLAVHGEGTVDAATKSLRFQLTDVALNLRPWQSQLQRLVLLPGGAWEMAGRVEAGAGGRWQGKEFAATAGIHLRGVSLRNRARPVTAAGLEADLEFTDLDNFRSKPGTLRIRELHTGRLTLRSLEAELAFAGPDQVVVSRVALALLGGQAEFEPFNCFPSQRELAAVVQVDGLDLAEVMALTPSLPARAAGRVGGRFALHLDDGGLRLGPGWLSLPPGAAAELQLGAGGQNSRGWHRLRLSELRFELRPPNAPPGRSATLHLAGVSLDSEGKVPVSLDLNVDGPLERFLDLGLDSGPNPGPGK